MVVVIVVVMVLAFGGAIAYAVKTRSDESAAAEAAGTGPNEFLQAPPSSFPGTVKVEAPPEPVAAPEPVLDEPAEAADQPARPEAPVAPAPASASADVVDDDSTVDAVPHVEAAMEAATADPTTDAAQIVVDLPGEAGPEAATRAETEELDEAATRTEAGEPDEPEDDDEAVVSRFRSPGSRSTANPDLLKPMAAARPVFHLEGDPTSALGDAGTEIAADAADVAAPAEAAPDAADDETRTGVSFAHPGDQISHRFGPSAPVVEAEADGAEAELPVTDGAEIEVVVAPPSADEVVAADDDAVIDLVDGPDSSDGTGGAERAWSDVVLEAEPDSVDHVLQALITRARFKQVGVEEVATELVERADLQGTDVSEVLAELVGRTDGAPLVETPTSELTLFNDEVPSRPGQLTDFARLAPAEKKRIIIRVLCLLVARSEDQQLPPRAEADGATPKSWPLARAVWPLATSGDDDGEPQLPSRRLAKSG